MRKEFKPKMSLEIKSTNLVRCESCHGLFSADDIIWDLWENREVCPRYHKELNKVK